MTAIGFINRSLKNRSEVLADVFVKGRYFTQQQMDNIFTEVFLEYLRRLGKRSSLAIGYADLHSLIAETIGVDEISDKKVMIIAAIIQAIATEHGYIVKKYDEGFEILY